MPGDQGKTGSGQHQIIGFAGVGADDVVKFVIDGDDMMPTGKYMFQ